MNADTQPQRETKRLVVQAPEILPVPSRTWNHGATSKGATGWVAGWLCHRIYEGYFKHRPVSRRTPELSDPILGVCRGTAHQNADKFRCN